MNPNEIGINELNARIRAELLRSLGIGAYGDEPWIVDVFPGRGIVAYGLSGKYFQRSYAVADDLSVTLGAETLSSTRTEWLPEFQTTFADDGDTWSGLIFRAGQFAERIVNGKPLNLDSDNIRKVVTNFSGFIPLRSDHNEDSVWSKVFDAFKAGVVRLWHNEDATELYAEIHRPSWLVDAFKNFAKKVSVRFAPTWDRLTELSLVENPRIVDAALFEAFSGSPDFPAFAASHPETAVVIRAKAFADTPDPNPLLMNEQEQMRAYFRANPEAARAAGFDPAHFANPAPAPAPVVATASGSESPALVEANARLKAVEDDVRAMSAQNADRDAEADAVNLFADELRSGRSVPADKDDVLRQYRAASAADRAADPATFDASKGHVAELKAALAKRAPKFQMGGGRIASQDPSLDNPGDVGLTSFFTAQDYRNANLKVPASLQENNK